MYAIVQQEAGVTQGLVPAKSQPAKQGLTIPRLELVSAHMGTNLVSNAQEALEGFPVTRPNGGEKLKGGEAMVEWARMVG